MKLQWKKPTSDRLAAWICAPLLALLGGGIMIFGKVFAWRIFWLWGLIGLLPGVIQTVFLLPVLQAAQPPETGKLKKLLYKLRCGYIRARPVVLVLGALAAAVGTLLLWRLPFSGESKLGYYVPVIAAVVFVICIAAEKWCQHVAADTAAGAQLRGIASGFFMLRMASFSVIAASVLRLTGFFNADAIVAVVLALVAAYEALILGFSFTIRFLRRSRRKNRSVMKRKSLNTKKKWAK